MQHWLEYADPPIINGTIIALIDPDMIFIRTLNIDFRDDNSVVYAPTRDDMNKTTKVQKGRPGNVVQLIVIIISINLYSSYSLIYILSILIYAYALVAQTYGIGAPWAYEGNKKINKYTVCTEPQSPCLTVKPPFANDHYRYAYCAYI